MSLQDCHAALRSDGRARLCAADFSMDELDAAAREAKAANALLFLYNLSGRSPDDISRLLDAAGRRLVIEDMQLI